jgi:hypothetical protein
VQTLENIVKFFGVVVFAINPAKTVQRLAAERRIFCDAQP